jgi:hypothetical protein
MSAKIKLPNGPEAEMSDAGIWFCEGRPDIAAVLQQISDHAGFHDYLPDPFELNIEAVVKETGALVTNYKAPPGESIEGTIY